MNYQFACARKLYAAGAHPRVMVSARDLETLRRQIKRGAGLKIMTGVRRKLQPVVERIRQAADAASLLQGPPGRMDFGVAFALHDLALAGVLARDAGMIDGARRVLLALPRFLERPEQLEPGAYGSAAGIFSLVNGGHACAYDLLYAHLSGAERAAYCHWLVTACIRPVIERARPYFYKSAGANTPIAETLPALIGLLAVRGDRSVPDLSGETAELISFLEASLHAAINPDGYPEEDIGYGTTIAAYLALIVEPLRRAGIYDVYKACPRYARVGRAILHFVQPWGEQLVSTGDHAANFWLREFILARQAVETRDQTLLWLLGTLAQQWPEIVLAKDSRRAREVSLKKFSAPASALTLLVMDGFGQARHPRQARVPTAFCDRGRGIVSFRSGWGPEDALVVFDGSQRSPAAQGHAHDSCGHFSLLALGEYFAIDANRYSIEQSCHNVVLIDGRSGRSTDGEWRASYYHGNLIDYATGNFCDFAAVDSSHQHNCYWAWRYLALVKGPDAPAYVWIVEDINKANDLAEFWWTLHTSPENKIELRGERAAIKGSRRGNWLDVAFVLPAPGSYPAPHSLALSQDVTTPSSFKYIPNPHERAGEYKRPADMVGGVIFERPRLIAKVKGYNGRFMSVLIPRREEEKPAQVESLKTLDNSLAARITFREVEDIIIFAYEHNLLEAGQVRARGQWSVVRRRRRDGQIIASALGQGTSLKI
ncbi:MAG: hypothetical protein HYV35_12135 [Lentisphaerae bacterium]|nr:hypothetical protein [Lentisphaerota bacterium]